MLVAAGLLLLVLGVACGALLLASALGAASAGAALWILFPVFALGGYLLAAAQARNARLPALTRATGALLLALALAAAIVLVAQGASLLEVPGGTASAWYVLAVGLFLGIPGLASRGPRSPEAPRSPDAPR